MFAHSIFAVTLAMSKRAKLLEGVSIAGRLATFAGAHGREYSGAEPLPQC